MNWSEVAKTAKLYLGLGSEEEYLQRGPEDEGGPPSTAQRQRTKRHNLVATLLLVVGIAALMMFVDNLAWRIVGVALLIAMTTALPAVLQRRSTGRDRRSY